MYKVDLSKGWPIIFLWGEVESFTKNNYTLICKQNKLTHTFSQNFTGMPLKQLMHKFVYSFIKNHNPPHSHKLFNGSCLSRIGFFLGSSHWILCVYGRCKLLLSWLVEIWIGWHFKFDYWLLWTNHWSDWSIIINFQGLFSYMITSIPLTGKFI